MNPLHRRLGLTLLATLVLATAACSGDATSSATTSGETTSTNPDGTPATTIPEIFEIAARPVEVEGDPLPVYDPEFDGVDPAVGMTAPIISGVDYDGNPQRIDGTEHDALLVVFLAHWCPHCNNEIPVLDEWAKSDTFPEGLEIIGVSTGFAPDRDNYPPGEWLDDHGWAFPVIADEVDWAAQTYYTYRAFGVSGFPGMVLLDNDGKVVARSSGEKSIGELTDFVFGRG